MSVVTFRGPKDPKVRERVRWLIERVDTAIDGSSWVSELETDECSTISMVVADLRPTHRKRQGRGIVDILDFDAYREAAQAVIQSKLTARQVEAAERISAAESKIAKIGIALTIAITAAPFLFVLLDGC